MASLARFHLRLLQSWLPVGNRGWSFIISLLQPCLCPGMVKGYGLSPSLQTYGLNTCLNTSKWTLIHPLFLKMHQNSDNPFCLQRFHPERGVTLCILTDVTLALSTKGALFTLIGTA